jgi:hypothetical protein
VLVTHSFEVDDPAAWEKYRELARGGAAGSVTGSADRQAHEAQGAALDAPPGSPADARARLGTPFGSLDAVGDRARHERICVDYDAAVHAQDWERLTALLHADLRHRDHRLAGGPELDRAGFVETNRQGSALVQQLRSTTRVLAVEGDQNVFMQVIVAETLDGGQMEIEWFAHLVLREDKIWRVDMYDSEAQARESLAGASADGPDEEAAADLGEHQRRR